MNNLDWFPGKILTEEILINVRVSPKAKKNQVGPIKLIGNTNKLLVYVSAPPSDNQANEAVIELLARAFSIAKSSVFIKSGMTSRIKTIIIKTTSSQMVVEKIFSLKS
jgi:uncharacterized protein (TIGR00251 family)